MSLRNINPMFWIIAIILLILQCLVIGAIGFIVPGGDNEPKPNVFLVTLVGLPLAIATALASAFFWDMFYEFVPKEVDSFSDKQCLLLLALLPSSPITWTIIFVWMKAIRKHPA